jgi:tetratricopeptide (TPR) repeat protein
MDAPGEIEDGRNRHTRYYMTILAQAAPNLTNSNVLDTVTILNKNIKNIRHAWQWAVECQLFEMLERGMKGLYQFYVMRGPFQEGYHLFESAVNSLNQPTARLEGQQKVLAQLLTYLARFSYELADYPASAETAQTAVNLAQETKQIAVEAEAQQLWGRALWRMGSYETTKTHFQKSLHLARQAAVKQFEADALRGLGVLEAHQGDAQNAIKQYKAAHEIYCAIDSVVNYQLRSREIIAEMRDLSTKNAAEIRDAVEQGKQRLAKLVQSGEALELAALPKS